MRSGTELILATKPYAKDSTGKSWWYFLSTTFLLMMALGGTLLPVPMVFRIASSLLTGLLILRLFVIYHDQQHHAILPRSKAAEGLMRMFGVYVLAPSSIWRSSHNYHHNHNSKLRSAHIGSFPIMTKTQFLRSSPSRRFQYLFIRHPATILMGYIFMFLYGMCLNPFLTDRKRHRDGLYALILHFALGGALLYWFGWRGLLLAQTLPHFLAYAIGTYLFYAQHNFPTVSFNDKAGWTYEKAALDSSSRMVTGRIMGWFTANIGYHHVHHLNARVPFYRLPEVVREIPELQNPKTTSLNPVDVFRCLRLKVWDVEAQKMVSLRELRASAPMAGRA